MNSNTVVKMTLKHKELLPVMATPRSMEGKKCEIFYGQESPRGESTTPDGIVNYYQLLAVMLLN